MYKNTICSLSLIYANYYTGRGDYIETFVPFIATLISKKHYDSIKVTEISNDFNLEYGIRIDYHPMITILTRCRKRKIIQKHSGNYLPIWEEVEKYDFSKIASQELHNQDQLITKISEFAKTKYNYALSNEDAESALIAFLKEYDLEILFASEERSLLPDVSIKKKDLFIIHSFIKKSYESKSDLFQIIVRSSTGHLIANSILYKEFDRYRSNLKKVCFYIDTRIIFRLLGFEGNDRKIIYKEFFNTLQNEGAILYLFSHTYEEIESILYDSLNWIHNPNYDPLRSNSVTRFFIESNYDKLDVQRCINNLKTKLAEIGITSANIIDGPSKMINTLFNVDEAKLHDTIIATYKDNIPNFDETEKEYTIQKDIDSIAAVYKLRGTSRPRTLKDAEHVFVTSNGALAYAAKTYELNETSDNFYLPACLTDIFIGTVIWLQSPAKIIDINIRKIIAQCYSALKPDPRLVSIFMRKVESLKAEKKLDENEYYMLRTSQVAQSLLIDKTMGDAVNFTSKLPFEIMDEMLKDIRKVENMRYQEEKLSHESTKSRLDYYQHKNLQFSSNIKKYIKYLSNIIIMLILAIGAVGLIFTIYPFFSVPNKHLSWFSIIIYSVLSFLSICTLFNKKFRQNIELSLFNCIHRLVFGKNDEIV